MLVPFLQVLICLIQLWNAETERKKDKNQNDLYDCPLPIIWINVKDSTLVGKKLPDPIPP